MYRGVCGSGSILRRMFFTWASIARSYDSNATPWMASSSWAAREDAAGLPCQREQQLELRRREVDAPVGDGDPHPADVELHVRRAHHLGMRQVAVDPAQNGPDTGDELARTERFRDVVVGPQLEADDAIGLLATCGEHDDRHGRLAAQRPRHVEAVDPRQPQVEHDEVRPASPGFGEGGRAVGRRDDGEARVLEVVAGDVDDPGFVVNDKDRAHWGDPTQAEDVEPGPSG